MVQERPVRVERRLSAILAADVAGYSRLMHHDEETTHAKLTAFLTNAVAPAIAEHGGRIVKNTGDGFLAEFPSAVGAVRAAVQFQARIHGLTIGDHVLEAFRLSPRDISAFRWINLIGMAKSQMGVDAEAVAWLRRSIEANPNSARPISFSLLSSHVWAT
jgi:class 3 adenylate cyclase